MDEELLNQIRESAQEKKHTRKLDSTTANAALALIEASHIVNPKKTWWWESLRLPSRSIEYGDADVFPLIAKLIGRNEVVRLVVTDDESPPWPVYEGPLDEILSVIAGQRFFEYFLVPAKYQTAGWIIFDTHHNRLVVTGEI
jgi:hypothetical protein